VKNNLVITILVAVVTLGAGFFGGMKYQQGKQPQMGQFRRTVGTGTPGNRTMGGNAFRPVDGQIISSDDKSITVKLQDGSSKIVFVSDQTQINKASSATKSDLTTGQTVAVFGQTNADGSVTAQNIQLNPTQMMFPKGTPAVNQ
jgi:hypothetical protein